MSNPQTESDKSQPAFDPLAAQGVTCILLSEAASRRLRLEGDCFAIVARTSYPQIPNRLAIFCQAVGPNISGDLCKILKGGHKAVAVKANPLPPPVPPPPADAEGRAAYRRASDGLPVRDSQERRRANELRDLEAIDNAADQWLVAHGCDTQVDRWNVTADEP
jgi:hypothetical protein